MNYEYDHIEANSDEITKHIQGIAQNLGDCIAQLSAASELNGINKGISQVRLYDETKWGLIREAYERGEKPAAIADRFEVDVRTVSARARDKGWKVLFPL